MHQLLQCSVEPNVGNVVVEEQIGNYNGVCGKSEEGFSTPKGRKLSASDVLVCPRAPMKKTARTKHFSSIKASVKFFNPPDIELFFLLIQ